MDPAVACRQLSRRRQIVYRAVALLIALAPFVAAEWTLRALDWGRPWDFADPYVGFSGIHPLFVLNEESARYETARSRRPWFNQESFAARKPANEYRIFVLGESTVQGQPF